MCRFLFINARNEVKRQKAKGKIMIAVEFETFLKKDGIIKVPEDVKQKINNENVRVIVLAEERKIFNREETNDRDRDRAENYINMLMKNPLKVDKSVPFLTRDELHNRKL